MLCKKNTYGETLGREYYTYFGSFSSRPSSWNDSQLRMIHQQYAYYSNMFYYIKHGYLFESTKDGMVTRVIFKIDEQFDTSDLYVNKYGIYLISEKQIKVIDFVGCEIASVAFVDEVESYYICDNRIYFIVYNEQLETYIAQWYDVNTNIMHIIHVGQTNILKVNSRGEKSVSKESMHYIMANQKRVVIWREFMYFDYPENVDDIIEVETAGWYNYDLETGEFSSLNCTSIAPHVALIAPHLINKKWHEVEDDGDWLPIAYFDMKHDLMWVNKKTDSYCYGEEYWEPRRIGVVSKEDNIANIPVWKIENRPGDGRHYFDGKHRYYAKHYYSFESYDFKGNAYQWNETGHGGCSEFQVLDKYLFLDKEAFGEDVYQLENHIIIPIKDSWMVDKCYAKMTDEEEKIIELYEGL